MKRTKIAMAIVAASLLFCAASAQAAEPASPMTATTPTMAVAPVAAMATAPATAPATTPATPAAPASNSIPWPTIIMAIGMVLVAVIKLLESFGVLKRVVKDPRWTTILNFTKKATEVFLTYAESTDNKWDDALARILVDINAALLQAGEKPLTPDEAEKAKAAATALKNVAKPDNA